MFYYDYGKMWFLSILISDQNWIWIRCRSFCILFCDSLHRMCKHQCLWSYVQMKNFGLISSYREMILLLFSTFSGRVKGKLRFYSNTDESCIFVKVLFPLFLDPSKGKHTKKLSGKLLAKPGEKKSGGSNMPRKTE